MIDRFEIVRHSASRPDAERILFCDGTEAGMFRPETDLELSHWRPNGTPREYRAGTSTEICFRFLDDPKPGPWTAVVNNHVDVDGILSVYALVHSDHARAHRRTLVAAAEIGDFWGWGDLAAQRVFQGITRLMKSAAETSEKRVVYESAFRLIPSWIDGTAPEIAELDAELGPLHRGVELIQSGAIRREEVAERLSHYIIPRPIAGEDDERASYVAGFNEPISEKALLWPQVRAQWDREKICVVSTERAGGWFHDLWFPGYLWADTEYLWRVPGLNYHDGMSSYTLDHPRLVAAFKTLQCRETSTGRWVLGGTPLSIGTDFESHFPLVGRCLNDSLQAAASQLTPTEVTREFANAFS